MMRYTDRHCRYLHRLLTRRALLYTEMITTGALLHGDVAAHLRFDPGEHPVALQLGGSDPQELARCVRLAQQWGYDEVNLNCGCPSDRVQRGAFGACLMAQPGLVADCVRAMLDVARVPITVKHRVGIDRVQDYGFMRDFVGRVADAGCRVFIVHARNAWLDGLSPSENRNIPPLRYEAVYRLKRDFPALTIVINGGVRSNEEIAAHLQQVDGVMVGRSAYHDPWLLSTWDSRFYGEADPGLDREQVEARVVAYLARMASEEGLPWASMARHMLGLRKGEPGARHWRRIWSDHRLKDMPVDQVAGQAADALAAARRARAKHQAAIREVVPSGLAALP